MATAHNHETKRESKDSSKRRHRGHRGDKAPSATAAIIDSAAYARPLEVRLPACATNKVALPPAPVTGQYKAMFEVEFANASPDTRIDLALAMRIDGYAILRNVQEVAANERQCVRLDMQTEAQKGQVASLSWRPFSRDTERLPPWLTITRAEARMSLVEPQPPSHVADGAPAGAGARPHLVHGDVPTEEATDATASCAPDNGVRGGSGDAAKGVGKDRRRHHRDGGGSRRRDGRRREHGRGHAGDQAKHRDNKDDESNDVDGAARHKEAPRKDDRQSRRHQSRRSDRLDESARQESRKTRDRGTRTNDGGTHHSRDAVVATALAAVAAARNAINNGNSDIDEDYDDESDAFVAPTPLPPPARMLVPITAMGRRAHHY